MTPALELSGLKKSFGKTEIIRGVDLSIGKNERHAIIGPNGAGKSTLFNHGPFRPIGWHCQSAWCQPCG
jgi:branched-chain amino acid transport system ATP-binding protein